MGQLRNKKIIQSRIFLDPNIVDIPSYDYDYSYPITVYEAVKVNMDDNAHSLVEELDSIYRLIADKQDMLPAGIAGQLMTYSGVPGQVGSLSVVKAINSDAAERTHLNIPTEKAIGLMLDSKVSLKTFNLHIEDTTSHVTDIERSRWNGAAPLSSLQAHISNSVLHITNAERALWNNSAKQADLEKHIYDTNNPHGTTAHHVGTYSQKEIDDMFASLRESFFNHLNISWDERSNQASLVEYNPAFWNPNFILAYDEVPPDVDDPSLTYFALQPLTNYENNESNDCIIWVHAPGLNWTQVGLHSMSPGDLVIRYPNTTMHTWIQGRFLQLFTDSTVSSEDETRTSDMLWRPSLDDEGRLVWTKSKETVAPEPMVIKGKDGYTPIKGVDYDDGKDGQGVPVGGMTGMLLVKITDENYDTTWRTLEDVLTDMVLAGKTLPDGLVRWKSIVDAPDIYDEPGDHEDGIMSQRSITRLYETINNTINQLAEKIDGPNGLSSLRDTIEDHLNDFNNPHRVTAASIGAVTTSQFADHVNNYENPHNVTSKQLGLGNVDNTHDIDKPISNAVQAALDDILSQIIKITNDMKNGNYITDIEWNAIQTTLSFEFRNGVKKEVVIPITEIFNSIYFDGEEKDLVIILPDKSEHRINIEALIQVYSGSIGTHIQVVVEDDNVIRASVIPGSIGSDEITTSVHLRGSPTTTTQPVSDKSTRIATTEFVRNQVIDSLISYEPDRPLSANQGRILAQRKVDVDDIISILNDIEGIDVIDNLTSTNTVAALSANMGRVLDLEKAPRIHTSPSGSTFGRATISLFGHARASDVDPVMDGTVSRGTDDGTYARGDHRHPTDVSRAPMHWPDVEHGQYEMTGEPRAATPPDNSNDNRIATTEWIRRNAVGSMEGKCGTAGNIAKKIATLESDFMEDPVFMRQKGSSVTIHFSATNTAQNPTLNVQGSGDAPMYFGGKPIIADMLKADHVYLFSFDGEHWNLINPSGIDEIDDGDNSNSFVSSKWVRRNAVGTTHGECTTAGTTANKIVTLKSTYMDDVVFIRQIGSTVAVNFTNADTSTAETKMNVNNTGLDPVRYKGAPLQSGMIGTKYTHLFEFDGTYWNLLNPVPEVYGLRENGNQITLEGNYGTSSTVTTKAIAIWG